MSHIESMIEGGIRINGSLAYVPLTRGFVATIDAVDVPLVEPWSWCAMLTKTTTTYAKRKFWLEGKQTTVLMHRVLMNPPLGLQVDHIDGNGLNNTRINLRLVSHKQNSMNKGLTARNTSGFKGVSWSASSKKWCAYIRYSGKNHYIGAFDMPEEAYKAYCKESNKHHGVYGRTC